MPLNGMGSIIGTWKLEQQVHVGRVHVTDHQLVGEGGHDDPDAVFAQPTAMASMTRL